jgi:L-asparaginase
MFHHSGSFQKLPVLLLHAGARDYSNDQETLQRRRDAIQRSCRTVWSELLKGLPAVRAVALALELLENEPSCNAGYGGSIQSDGACRLTASIMNGTAQKFSGVMLVTHVVNPSKLALALQEREQSVLGPYGAQLLARELGIPPQRAVEPGVAQAWAEFIRGDERNRERTGTVGAVVIDLNGEVSAGTSTGGTYMNVPERISDSATVAGNYASPFAGISCTGAGEEIVDDAVAARIETRVRDGLSLRDASEKIKEEGIKSGRTYGYISASRAGEWSVNYLSENMPSCVMTGELKEALWL